MSHYNFDKNTMLIIKEVPHKYVGQSLPGIHQIINGRTGALYIHDYKDGRRELPSDEAIDELRLSGDLKIVRRQHGGGAIEISDCDAADCDELDPNSGKMFAQCVVLDDNGVKNGFKAVKAGLDEFWTPELIARFGPADNPHSVRRWRAKRGKPGQRTQKQMVRMWGRGADAPYFDSPVNDQIQLGAASHYLIKTSYVATEAEVCARILDINAGLDPEYDKPVVPFPIPSYATIRRACIALENSITLAIRDGKTIVGSEWRGAGKKLTASRALELAIMDHSPIPAFCVIDPEREVVLGQPWLSICIDVHSRVVLSHLITFRDPSFSSVAELIRRANLPKRPPPAMLARYPGLQRICGGAAEYIVDNGAEFRGHGLEDAAKSAGFSIRFCPIKKPRYKAIGERIFGTVFPRLQECLPGSTRPIAWTRKAEYKPEKARVVTTNQIEALVNQLLAEYHTDTNDGLQGRQPLLMFEKSTAKHGIDLHSDMDAFMREIMEVKLGVQLSKSGVRMFGLRYHDVRAVPELLDDLIALEPRRQRRDDATVTGKVKFNAEDIRQIHFWNRKTRKYVALTCDDESYADGMPLAFHEAIKAAAEAEGAAFNTPQERLAARASRVRALRDITPEAKAQERETLAKLLEIPRIRQITGNIVHLHTVKPHPVTVDDFIAHDLATTTSLDDEILAPREPIAKAAGARRISDRDPRDAGAPRRQTHDAEPAAAPARRRASSRRLPGGGK